MKLTLAFFWVLIFSLSCNRKPKTVHKIVQPEYIKVEVYCFCVSELSSKNQTLIYTCSTPALVHAYKLISPDALFYSTGDKIIVKRIEKVFFSKQQKIDTLSQFSDARFVILLKKSDLNADTLVFHSEYEFNFNEKYRFGYSFQVMDSLRSIFNKKKLTCE